MSFIEQIKQRAKQEIKTIVLPEATDVRILEAAEMIKNEGYAKVILIGNEEEVRKLAKERNIDIGETKIIDPAVSIETARYSKELYELRKSKGMTEEQAEKLVLEPVYFGMMMVKLNEADGTCIRSRTFYIRYIKTSITNIKNCTRNKASISIFRNGSSKL